MKACQSAYYSHCAKCERCHAHVELGRVNTSCPVGWQRMLEAMKALDDPYQERAYPSQAWVDTIREHYVEWIADNTGEVLQ